MRIDQYLVIKEYYETRSIAQANIKKGCVFVNGNAIFKNSYDVSDVDMVSIEGDEFVAASRAAYKLLDVIEPFGIQLEQRICIDVGASTGGFSEVCINKGAIKVYAVDVGKDQLLMRLQQDPRIVNMEGVNCRYITPDMFDPRPDFACMDVSFISIKLILPALLDVLTIKELVILIKPQFEAGKQYVGKNGIIKDEKVHMQVLSDMLQYVSSLGMYVHHLQASSLLGRHGNKEFVMHVKQVPCHNVYDLKQLVKDYHVKR